MKKRSTCFLWYAFNWPNMKYFWKNWTFIYRSVQELFLLNIVPVSIGHGKKGIVSKALYSTASEPKVALFVFEIVLEHSIELWYS